MRKELELESLKIFNKNGLVLYRAGLPGFSRNFTRDGILSAILMQNKSILKDQLKFCAEKQGKVKNFFTGEEPGKIFHESPGVRIRKLSTEYNACDTTALFLLGHEIYQKLTKDFNLAETQKSNIEGAKSYILRHLKNGAFLEDPNFCDNHEFALKVTYWKDSEIYGRDDGRPVYPVTYSLAHAQNICGLRSAMFLLKDKNLEKKVSEMLDYLNLSLFDKKTSESYLLVDKKGPVSVISSDCLHMLFYLKKGDISPKNLKSLIKDSLKLETKWGYRVLSEEDAKGVGDVYHAKTLWPFEQALIHIGAGKFKLDYIQKISSRIMNGLNTSHEIILFDGVAKETGNNPQLWTLAAKDYFKKHQKGVFP